MSNTSLTIATNGLLNNRAAGITAIEVSAEASSMTSSELNAGQSINTTLITDVTLESVLSTETKGVETHG